MHKMLNCPIKTNTMLNVRLHRLNSSLLFFVYKKNQVHINQVQVSLKTNLWNSMLCDVEFRPPNCTVHKSNLFN